jgi:uncharacterized LabA/DUF88 family protein
MRVTIFIDGKNYYEGSLAPSSGRRVSFPALADWLVAQVGGSVHWGTHYYTGTYLEPASMENREETGRLTKELKKFLNGLELERGFFVHRFPREPQRKECPHCGRHVSFSREKEVDTTLVADMLRLAAVDAFDVAVLVSGDRDHAPAVEGVRLLGKQVYVATWGKHGLANRLRAAAFDHIDLSAGVDTFAAAVQSPDVITSESDSGGDRPDGHSLGSDPDAVGILVAALRSAERRLPFVGANYFLRRWRDPDLEDSLDIRSRLLDSALKTGRVELYAAPDGSRAIRAAPDRPEEEGS